MYTNLPHRVVIQSESRTTFSGGAYTTSWTTYSTEWANCQPFNLISGDMESTEYFKKQQFTMWNVVFRYNANINNTKRILYNDKILHIESVKDPTGRKRVIRAICREEVL
jgi:SPP1 family predicted phage head-tail adaptor